MKIIESITVAAAIDEEGQIEGICGVMFGGDWMPLVSADEERYAQIRVLAKMVAANGKKTIKMVRFTTRSEVETITPQTMDEESPNHVD